jgi:hypothetical protein
VIVEALRTVDGIEQEPPPEAIPCALEASTVNIRVRWWSDPHIVEVVQTHGRVIAAVKKALGQAGIDLPFPTRVILFHDHTEATDGDRSRQREGWPAGDDPPAPRHLDVMQADDPERHPEPASDGSRPFWRRSVVRS